MIFLIIIIACIYYGYKKTQEEETIREAMKNGYEQVVEHGNVIWKKK